MIKKKLLTVLLIFTLSSCEIVMTNSSTSTDSSPDISESITSLTSDETLSSESSENEVTSDDTSSEDVTSESSESSEATSESNVESSSESSSDTSSSPEIVNPFEKARNIENYLSDEGDIPLVNINTVDNQLPSADIALKDNYVPGTLSIVEQPNQSNVLFASQSMGIRYRGNSTLDCDKKAYRIKFDEKQSLFGLPKAKSWVLLANYYDKSNIRNYLAFLTANKLSNLDFQPSSIFVDVKVNGDYRGLYMLCEQMQTGKGRVDIEKMVGDDGRPSFFIELDDENRLKDEGEVENVTYVKVNNRCFNIKYPEDELLTSDNVTYIKTYLQNTFNAINSGVGFTDYIDIGSFIDTYLVNELFKNPDAGNLSMYYYLTPNGKLTAGPVWDFDIALDAVGPNEYDNVYAHYYNTDLFIASNDSFISGMLKNTNFKNMLKERYSEVRNDYLYDVFYEINVVEKSLKQAQDRNVSKWALPGNLSYWISYRFYPEYRDLKSVTEHYDYLRKVLNKRFKIMDDEYLLS